MQATTGTEIRVLAATRGVWLGFREASCEAMRRHRHFIGCDCGSTDPAPIRLWPAPQPFHVWLLNETCA